jgi:hypothetical protein
MKKLTAGILTILFFVFPVAAQSGDNRPRLFDEFGKLSIDDTGARVLNPAYELAKTKNSTALVRIYGGREERFAFPYIIWTTRSENSSMSGNFTRNSRRRSSRPAR